MSLSRLFQSFFPDRGGYSKSTTRTLTCGVPQASVLGPLLYVLYTAPVADIIKSHNLQYLFYADVSQLYVTFKTNCDVDAGLSRSRVEHCVADIDRWMTDNKLKLNEFKSEPLVISSKYRSRPMITSASGSIFRTNLVSKMFCVSTTFTKVLLRFLVSNFTVLRSIRILLVGRKTKVQLCRPSDSNTSQKSARKTKGKGKKKDKE